MGKIPISIINEEGPFKEKKILERKQKKTIFLCFSTAVGPLPSGASFLLTDLCETHYGSTVGPTSEENAFINQASVLGFVKPLEPTVPA